MARQTCLIDRIVLPALENIKSDSHQNTKACHPSWCCVHNGMWPRRMNISSEITVVRIVARGGLQEWLPLKAAGAGRVHWLTHTTNAQARILYDQVADNLGFIQYRKIL
jgi:hypothetical protein